jgi:hypothetical protein
MKHLILILPLLLSAVVIVGCASDFQSSGSDQTTSDPIQQSDDGPATAQAGLDQSAAQAASDASNAAAQAETNAAQAAAQETLINANNSAPPSN